VNVKQLEQMIEVLPKEIPVMLEGVHGIGKSEVISQILTKMGYETVTLFVGQMADAGDFIGLPDRVDVTYKDDQGNEKTSKLTEFCPPKWWPIDHSSEKKLAIFLDEANRGKPEINQCLMDMILNRKLNGLVLPENTRIFGAINPLSEEYHTLEMDAAFCDRWLLVPFSPDVDEWLEYAAKKRFHNVVISYININSSDLDAPSENLESNKVYPSRRSWERVSEVMKNFENIYEDSIEKNKNLLINILSGIVGLGVASKFCKFYLTEYLNIHPSKLVLEKNKEKRKVFVEKIKNLKTTEVIGFIDNLSAWILKNTDTLDTVDSKEKSLWVSNVKFFINSIDAEMMMRFVANMQEASNKNEKWPEIFVETDPQFLARKISIETDDDIYEKLGMSRS